MVYIGNKRAMTIWNIYSSIPSRSILNPTQAIDLPYIVLSIMLHRTSFKLFGISDRVGKSLKNFFFLKFKLIQLNSICYAFYCPKCRSFISSWKSLLQSLLCNSVCLNLSLLFRRWCDTGRDQLLSHPICQSILGQKW